MTFLKVRLQSIFAAAFIALMVLPQWNGNLFAQTYYATTLAELNYAITDVANSSGGTFDIVINTTLNLDGEILELVVPNNVAVNISGTGTINGEGTYRGLVIQTNDNTSTVNITGITFQNCVATGGDGGDGQVGGGGGAGLGAAIYVRGSDGSVSLTDVTFRNNAAVGGDGGSVIEGSTTAGGGGGLGGDGGSGSAGDGVYGAGGGGGFGIGADGGSADSVDGNDGISNPRRDVDGGNGFSNTGASQAGDGGENGGGGGGAYGTTSDYAAGGGGGENGGDANRDGLKNIWGGNGGYGGGGGGSTEYGGAGGTGGGGGGGNLVGGDGGFGGGGGGSLSSNKSGDGGYGAGDGGGGGGGGLGAGGDLYVESSATGSVSVSINYTSAYVSSTTNLFGTSTITGGTGGDGAGDGDALGAIFLNGNNVSFGATGTGGITITGNISDLSGASNFDKWNKDASTGDYDIATYSGGIIITGTDAVTLKGDNTYAGVTEIQGGAILVASGKAVTDSSGKTTYNAIGDLSEVQLDGELYLDKSETIGFLSGSGTVYLYDYANGTGGKTLVISGDEDKDQFGAGINPATGLPVWDFTGKIETDGVATTSEHLVKTGTGRLTLGGDNSNAGDEFLTTIYQGTVVLGDAAGLGGGAVSVKNIDTGTGSKLRNVLEADTDLTESTGGAVMNNFSIVSSGTNLDGVSQTFNDFVVGGNSDIQFGQTGVEGGKISGGNLLVNMDAATDKVILANEGYDAASATNIAANLNGYAETRIKNGTVVVNSYTLATGAIGDTLGNGSVRAYAMETGDVAVLSAADNGMTIDNNLIFDEGSALTLSNETGVDYTLTGGTSGKGDMIVNLDATADSVTMTGNLGHTGATKIENGNLVIDRATTGNTVLYDLSASTTGALEVVGGDLYVNIKSGKTITYSGTIDLFGTGQTLYKTGNGTWVFDATGTIIDDIDVNTGALQLNEDGNVSNVTLSGNGQLIVNNDVTLANLTSSSLSADVTINGNNTLTLTTSGTVANGNTLYNTWTGGTDAKVEFQGDTTLYNLYQSASAWKGTMIVGDGTTGAELTVASPGALGNPYEAKVQLNQDSTLVIDTYVDGYNPTTEQIAQLIVAGADTTVDVKTYSTLATGTISGTDDVTKTGAGTWAMLDDSGGLFTGDVNLGQGSIYLQRTWDSSTSAYHYDGNWGDGALNVTGLSTSLLIDIGDVAKDVDNTINLDNTLNVYVYDYSVNGSSVNFGGDMTGTGGVNFNGTGTLVYDGAGTKDYTGDTNVNGGTLRVETGTTATDYYVNSGGTLEFDTVSIGSGDVTVNSGGTLTGTGATTSGDMTFNSGSTLIADYSGTAPTYTANDVTINNGAVAHVAGTGGNDPIGALITSGGTQSGMFWFTDDVQGKRAVGQWSGGNLNITFEDVVYLDNAYTTNATNVASYLNAIADNSVNGQGWSGVYPVETATARLLNDLENVLPSQYDYALLEVGGQINPSMVTAQVQTTSYLFQSITKQLYPADCLVDDYSGYGYAVSNGGVYRGQSVRSGWTGWASATGVFGDTSSHNSRGAHGYDFTNYGMVVGFEPTSAMSVNRLGMFYAYNYTKIDTNKSLGNGHITSNFFGAYGRFVDSMGYTSFVAGFGFDDYKSTRYVSVPSSTGYSRSKFDGWEGGLYIERGITHSGLAQWGLQPYVGLQYLYLDTDAFAETGDNPYRLETDSSNVNSLRTNLGLRHSRQVARVKRGCMNLTANVSWMHEFLDADCVMTSKWAVSGNPSTFGTIGNSLGRDWAVVGAGFDWSLRQNVSLFGSYDLQINGYQTLNVANAGARIQW